MCIRDRVSTQSTWEMKKDKWKVVVLGEARVGKTSMIRRLINDTFDDHEISTVNYTNVTKILEDYPSEKYKLSLWDTAGQERYHALSRSYYQNAVGALVVLDITDSDSFTRMKKWIAELNLSCPGIPIIIAGNKADVESQRQVPKEECVEFANSKELEYIETSAKTGSNVTEAFLKLGRAIKRNLPTAKKEESRGNGIHVTRESLKAKPVKSKCC
eukprot:TRINITY_DN5751_c0_g2_i1.p1 TRINITY_DN5751_c0_g2~~TRINITY_DN5751_c0_g2_i1.p1  ORF type:complete len:215 (-),score=37.59 TRINITY_DN5751_c0_g2_i1:5-649(-)